MSLTFSSMNRSNILSYHKNKEAGRACSRSACRGSSRFYMAVRMELPDPVTPSVIHFWNRLNKCNHILKEKIKKIIIEKIFFLDFTSASAKSNMPEEGVDLAQIKKNFSQKCFIIRSSIRSQTDVTFREKH